MERPARGRTSTDTPRAPYLVPSCITVAHFIVRAAAGLPSQAAVQTAFTTHTHIFFKLVLMIQCSCTDELSLKMPLDACMYEHV